MKTVGAGARIEEFSRVAIPAPGLTKNELLKRLKTAGNAVLEETADGFLLHHETATMPALAPPGTSYMCEICERFFHQRLAVVQEHERRCRGKDSGK